MPLDYALHEMGTPNQGNMPPAPVLPAISPGQVKLADGANSAAIIVTESMAVLVCSTPADLRLDVQPTANLGALNPAASGVLVQAGVPRFFMLRRGSWTLKTAVY